MLRKQSADFIIIPRFIDVVNRIPQLFVQLTSELRGQPISRRISQVTLDRSRKRHTVVLTNLPQHSRVEFLVQLLVNLLDDDRNEVIPY
jgi:hypothetical protein